MIDGAPKSTIIHLALYLGIALQTDVSGRKGSSMAADTTVIDEDGIDGGREGDLDGVTGPRIVRVQLFFNVIITAGSKQAAKE